MSISYVENGDSGLIARTLINQAIDGVNSGSLPYTGSAKITGSLSVTGSTISTLGFTGSLQGTATTASYVLNAVSASFVTTASYVLQAVSASFASTASYVLQAVSASFASTASYVVTAQTASYVITAQTASYVLQAISASHATTASFITTAQTASYVNTASYAIQALSASYAPDTTFPYTGSAIISGSLAITGSLASGLGMVLSGSYQHVGGFYNTHGDKSSLFIIGNGMNDGARSDIFRVTSGNAQVTGSLNISGSLNVDAPNGEINLTGSLKLSGGGIAPSNSGIMYTDVTSGEIIVSNMVQFTATTTTITGGNRGTMNLSNLGTGGGASGLIIPTTVPSAPNTGSMYVDFGASKLYLYSGTAWVSSSLA
jgi:hypothetical protein